MLDAVADGYKTNRNIMLHAVADGYKTSRNIMLHAVADGYKPIGILCSMLCHRWL